MIDLCNEEHVRCLRETVALFSDLTPEQHETWLEKLRRDCAVSEHGPREVLAAVEALSDPAKAAELIRQLVERAGVQFNSMDLREDYLCLFARTDGIIEFEREDPDGIREEWEASDIPALILRLLSLAPNAGADAVLAALRGE